MELTTTTANLLPLHGYSSFLQKKQSGKEADALGNGISTGNRSTDTQEVSHTNEWSIYAHKTPHMLMLTREKTKAGATPHPICLIDTTINTAVRKGARTFTFTKKLKTINNPLRETPTCHERAPTLYPSPRPSCAIQAFRRYTSGGLKKKKKGRPPCRISSSFRLRIHVHASTDQPPFIFR